MKVIASTVLVALFAVSQGRFLDATNPALAVSSTYGTTAFVNSLNCGQCIGLGHTYCVKQAENTITNAYQTGTTNQKCVQSGTSDTAQTDATWSCSNAFADRVYSKYTCQVNTSPCGTVQSYTLANTTSTANFNISGLALGQTCFYKVAATCGGPAFKPNDTSRVEIEFVDFKDADLDSTTLVKIYNTGGASNDTAKRAGTPVSGMPRRDHYFFASLGGNMIANANYTSSYNSSTNGTIFGRSGRYDKVAGGRKVYGNPTQGDAQLANLTSQTQLDCQGRNMYLAVTATTDAASLRVDLSSVSFYRPTAETTGASFVTMSLAALLGLISLAFF